MQGGNNKDMKLTNSVLKATRLYDVLVYSLCKNYLCPCHTVPILDIPTRKCSESGLIMKLFLNTFWAIVNIWLSFWGSAATSTVLLKSLACQKLTNVLAKVHVRVAFVCPSCLPCDHREFIMRVSCQFVGHSPLSRVIVGNVGQCHQTI